MKPLPLVLTLLLATVASAQLPVYARATFTPETTLRGYVRIDVAIAGNASGSGLRLRPPNDLFASFAADARHPVTCLLERGGQFRPILPCPQRADELATTVWFLENAQALRFFLPVMAGAREFSSGIRELRVQQLARVERLPRRQVARAAPAASSRQGRGQNCHLEDNPGQTAMNDLANESARAAGVPWAQRHYGESRVVCD